MKRFAPSSAVAVLMLLVLAGAAASQTPLPPPIEGAQAPPDPVASAPRQPVERTRQELGQLLRELPPAVRGGIALDPSLMDNVAYMAPYPRLTAFLREHPEVRRDPAYFFGAGGRVVLERTALDAFSDFFTVAAVLTGIMTALIVVGSVLRQAVNYRRWLRRARMQTEVHTKILDRLQSNEDLIAYIQTPAGRQFLEFGSSPGSDADAIPARVAPFGRILWSVQAGVVLTALGFGFWIAQRTVPEEVAGALGMLAVVVTAVGLGAIASGGAAYALSVRLGFLPPPGRPTGSPDA